MNLSLSVSELQSLCDFAAHEARVEHTFEAALDDDTRLLRLLTRYASWNSFFGSGVASLAGKIGRSRGLFADPDQEITALADRSVLVASYFFDAARDEFDDRDTLHRDTHRCLSQSLLHGLIAIRGTDLSSQYLAELLSDPTWLTRLNARVAEGYGVGTPDTLPAIFACIGYHLGSELLADREFSIIDSLLRTRKPELVQALRDKKITIGGQEHQAYQWIAVHSGHGGGAEAEHFEWATQGAKLALRYVPEAQRTSLREDLHQGFVRFAEDHQTFFEEVASDPLPLLLTQHNNGATNG